MNYASANVTAFGGADYASVSGTLSFGTNVTTQNIVVPIINDKQKEGDEVFTVTLSVPGGEASLGAQVTTTVTIVDDDSVVQFASATASALESQGAMSVTINRVGVIDTLITVPFGFGDVTATNGVEIGRAHV